MYHDKTIYILKAHVKESVMGRVFFPGGAPLPPHRGGLLPPIFHKKISGKNNIFSDRTHSTESYEQKILKKIGPGGAQPPIYVKPFVLNRLGLCKCIMIKLYIF